MAIAVGVVFSPGGKVYSFDPGGLALAWNTRVICQTSRGLELGRVVKPNHELETEPSPHLKRVVRRATHTDEETNTTNQEEAKRAMKVFREVMRQSRVEVKPVSAELVFDGSRLIFAYEAEGRPDLTAFRDELRLRLSRRIELRSVGPRECARLCGDQGLCGGKHCCRRFPSHEQPITLRMAKDQDLPMSSGRITGLCGRLRCCLALENSTYL
jgi:cell fate regulator YaaT (PSP1 superfamily)